MIKSKLKKYLYKYYPLSFRSSILLLIGLILIFSYIYFIFIFERPIRKIPFTLNIWVFGSLLVALLIQIYLFYKFFKPSGPSKLLTTFVKEYLFWILDSLSIIDDGIKKFSVINKYYNRFLNYLIHNVTDKSLLLWRKIILVLLISPRVILITMLFVDVFYFKQLCYIYKVLWLTIIPFFVYYLLYCLRKLNKDLIDFLEKNVENIDTTYVYGILPPEEDYWNDSYVMDEDESDEEPPHEMRLPVKQFLEYRWSCVKYNDEHKNDEIFCNLTTKYRDKQRQILGIAPDVTFKGEQLRELFAYPKRKIDEIMKIHQILEVIKKAMTEMYVNTNIWGLSLLILWLSFLSWFYILIVSLPSLSLNDLLDMLIKAFNMINENPFSNIKNDE